MLKVPSPSDKTFFEKISKEFKKELPGEDFQLKMAPSIRKNTNTVFFSEKKQGSILILLYPIKDKINTVLIKRTTYNGVHSGQISFPGGKLEENDLDLFQTALRETKEEIGINPKEISILGKLTPIYIPASNITVLPVIGKIDYRPDFIINKKEVQYTIETSLINFFIPDNLSVKTIQIDKQNVTVPFYNINNEHIWGATAMILSEFTELIRRINSTPL